MSRSDDLRNKFFSQIIRLRSLFEKEVKNKEEADRNISSIEKISEEIDDIEKSILSRIISVQNLENESENLEIKIGDLKKQVNSLENQKKGLLHVNQQLNNIQSTIRNKPTTSNVKKEIESHLFLVRYLIDFGFNHLEPLQFEELTLKVFEAMGFKGELTPITGDNGIDIVLTDPKGIKGVVQCKRYAEDQSISPKEVREFLGSMIHAKAEYGYFTTTTSFSEQAKEFSKGKTIFLIDRTKLKQLFLLAVQAEIDCSTVSEFENDPRHLISTKLSF
jgi:HJR/Mrr/RecB family endonuclease